MLHCKGLTLEIMNGQKLCTLGQVQLSSLRSGNLELGPVSAHVVPTLPSGADVVLGLSLLLRHGCWMGCINGHPSVRWGALVGSARPGGAAAVGAATTAQPEGATAQPGGAAAQPGGAVVVGATKTAQSEGTAARPGGAAAVGAATTARSGCADAVAVIDDQDFVAEFRGGRWVVSWKWLAGAGLHGDLRKLNYAVPAYNQEAFDLEVQLWVADGILM